MAFITKLQLIRTDSKRVVLQEAAKKTSSLRQRPQKLLMAERVLRRKAVVLLHFEERLSASNRGQN